MLLNIRPNTKVMKSDRGGRHIVLGTDNERYTVRVMAEGNTPEERESALQLQLMDILSTIPEGGWFHASGVGVTAFKNPVFVVDPATQTRVPKTDANGEIVWNENRYYKSFGLSNIRPATDEEIAAIEAKADAIRQANQQKDLIEAPAVLSNTWYVEQVALATQAREAAGSKASAEESVGLPA